MRVRRLPATIAAVIAAAVLASCSDRSSDDVAQNERSPLNADYIIDGRGVHLTDGESDAEAAPGSASRIVTRYFGNEARVDLDGDGSSDTVFLLTQTSGGSGTFYYIVAALERPGGIVGSHGLLLGDRIVPQSMTVGSANQIVVNYADRSPGEGFAVAPSIGRTLNLRFQTDTLNFDVTGKEARD